MENGNKNNIFFFIGSFQLILPARLFHKYKMKHNFIN